MAEDTTTQATPQETDRGVAFNEATPEQQGSGFADFSTRVQEEQDGNGGINSDVAVGNALMNSPTIDSAALNTADLRDDIAKVGVDAQKDLVNTQNELAQPEFQEFRDFTGEIEASRAQNKDYFAQSLEQIKKDFDDQQQIEKDSARIRTGAQSKALARMGALGNTGSGLSWMQSVSAENSRTMANLLSKKAGALLAVSDAAARRDLEGLQIAMKESHDVINQLNDVRQMEFDNALMSKEEARAQQRFGWDIENRFSKKLSDLAGTYDEIDDSNRDQIAEWEKKANLPEGYYSNILDLNKDIKENKDALDDIDIATKLGNALQNLPEDLTIQIGEDTYKGKWFEGTQTFVGIEANTNTGEVTGINWDKRTGKFSKESLGNISTKSGDETYVDENNDVWILNKGLRTIEPLKISGTNGDFLNPEQLEGFDEYFAELGGVITQPFRKGGVHNGIDIDVGEIGDDLTAFSGGVVSFVQPLDSSTGYGTYIEILGDDGRLYRYGHLLPGSVPTEWEEGETRIEKGEVIGQMGASGDVVKINDGGHLHFEAMIPKAGEQFNSGSSGGTDNTRNEYNDYYNALNNTLPNGITEDNVKRAEASLQGYLKNDDIGGAQDFLIRQAEKGSGIARQGKMIDLKGTLKSLDEIEVLLNEYVRVSGDTGILEGTILKAAEKLGTTTDPQLSYIKNRIGPLVAQYTVSMSGVQFSDKERGMYEGFFANISNVNELNMAKISALKDQLNLDFENKVEGMIGTGVYDKIFADVSKSTALPFTTMQEYINLFPEQTDSVMEMAANPAYTEEYIMAGLGTLYNETR